MLTKFLINYITLISLLFKFLEIGSHICRFAFAANVIPSPSNTNCVITFWWFKLDSCWISSDFQFFHRPATWTPCVFQIVSKTILSCILGKSTDKNDARLEEKSVKKKKLDQKCKIVIVRTNSLNNMFIAHQTCQFISWNRKLGTSLISSVLTFKTKDKSLAANLPKDHLAFSPLCVRLPFSPAFRLQNLSFFAVMLLQFLFL